MIEKETNEYNWDALSVDEEPGVEVNQEYEDQGDQFPPPPFNPEFLARVQTGHNDMVSEVEQLRQNKESEDNLKASGSTSSTGSGLRVPPLETSSSRRQPSSSASCLPL